MLHLRLHRVPWSASYCRILPACLVMLVLQWGGLIRLVPDSFSSAAAAERTERFDRDPGWEGHNNRSTDFAPQEVRQDFGYSETRHAGGTTAGEIGGWLTPTAEPAYYAKEIQRATFDDPLEVSGKIACTGRQFHVLVGFFNADSLNDWRTPNSIVFRLYGRGDVFYAYVEYATSRWRAGGDSPGGFSTVIESDTGRQQLKGFASLGKVHNWSLRYDPAGNNGRGSVTATIDNETAICHLDAGHKADGAVFNRCGLLSIPKHYDQGGDVWVDDLTINGEREDFANDPKWDARGNHRIYKTKSVRPRFDFGYSATRFAGGQGAGELGGVVFRGDIRVPEKIASYGDRLERLSVDKPLKASGRISLRRAVSDSTVLLGFYNSRDSLAVTDSQSSGFPMNFLGLVVEGPSREGFLVYPAYRLANGAEGYSRDPELGHILPDGSAGEWSFEYQPGSEGTPGRLSLSYAGRSTTLDVPQGNGSGDVRFDRFGLVTTWIDGNAQEIFFDDLTYTWRQGE